MNLESCDECGALLDDRVLHRQWHEMQDAILKRLLAELRSELAPEPEYKVCSFHRGKGSLVGWTSHGWGIDGATICSSESDGTATYMGSPETWSPGES